jgi:hypothetical protein
MSHYTTNEHVAVLHARNQPEKEKTFQGVRVRISQFREIISNKLLSVFTTVRAVKEHMPKAFSLHW